jgi:transketolase
MAYAGQAVHVACAFSIVELVTALYGTMNLGEGPRDPERDRLVLSKGHGVMALYACFREFGWLNDSDLDHYFADGTLLKGLCDAHIPGCEVSGGSLGHGLSVAVGLALGAKRSGARWRVYVIVGDGELDEGAVWEGLAFASHWRLDNLVVVVDNNGWQAMGRKKDVLAMGSLHARMAAFGLEVLNVDGHDLRALDAALSASATANGLPKAILAQTIKGCGVSFMEDDNTWHYTRLDADTYARACAECGKL